MTQATLSIDSFLAAAPGPEIEPRRLAGRRRRALVLTSDGARHPFRASLPPHVTRGFDDAPVFRFWRLSKDDIRGFASVYVAAFAAMLVFIL